MGPGPRFGWYGFYSGWYAYPQITQTQIAVIETTLFDVRSQRIVWSATSETLNPSSVQKDAPGFADVILASLRKDGSCRRHGRRPRRDEMRGGGPGRTASRTRPRGASRPRRRESHRAGIHLERQHQVVAANEMARHGAEALEEIGVARVGGQAILVSAIGPMPSVLPLRT